MGNKVKTKKVIWSKVVGNKHEYGKKECDEFPIDAMLEMQEIMWTENADIHKLRENYKKHGKVVR